MIVKEREKPTFKQLEYFISISEHSSFRKAAERLAISQPTLTAQISLLEDRIGLPLLERSRSGSNLSSAGRRLLPHAKKIVEQLNQLVDVVSFEDLGPSGTYKLGVPPTLGPYLLPHLLPDLHQKYSKLQLHIREAAPSILEEGLINGNYDLVISPLPLDDQKLTVVRLFREPLSLVSRCDHPQIRQQSVASNSLVGAEVLTLEQKHHYHRQVRTLCEKLGMQMKRDYAGTSLDGLRQMVVMGMGIAFLPALYIDSDVKDQSELQQVNIEGESITRTIALAWRPSSPSSNFFSQLATDLKTQIHARAGSLIRPC